MTIKFITVCPKCGTTKRNEFKGLGESHARWIQEQTGEIKWTCDQCEFSGDMPVRDVEVIR